MLLKGLLKQVHILLLVLHALRDDELTILIVLQSLIDGPPPTMVLKYLYNQLSVVTFANKAFVKLE